MRTDDLIAALAADTKPQAPVLRQMALPLSGAVGLSIASFALFWGPRPDIWAALGSPAVLKTLIPLVLVSLAAALALTLAHPGRAAKGRVTALGAVIIPAALVFMAAIVGEGLAGLVSALSTPQLLTCLLSVPLLAAPLLGVALWGLSSGASLRPWLTGAMAGLATGGLAAAIYSVYCDKDMVLFVLPAYGMAIASVTLAGALIGARVLKW
ncbi:MAG: DUF1109 family protein [Rhodobacteraceae bacterium]|nr:MAG: DUF1109 family protein [Paracoccaceae bacterium]